MKIYLDVCAIQRPLDTASDLRVVLEAEAVLGILALCEGGELNIVSSDALVYETQRNPWPVRQDYAWAVLSKADEHIELSAEINQRAQCLVMEGFQPLDALHLAMAEAAEVDVFCTCDDKLLRTAARIRSLRVRVTSPLDLAKELGK